MILLSFIKRNRCYLIDIPRSLLFNLRLMPFRQAIRCPIFFYRNVRLKKSKGQIVFDVPHISSGMVKIGYPSSDFFCGIDKSILSISGKLIIRGNITLGAGCRISVGYNSELILGNNMWITGNCLMIVRKYVEFKNNAVLAWNVTIMDHDAHNIYDISSKQLINEPEPVIVGNHTWVGCNVAILKGSYIPDNSIVGAGSVITKKPRKENSIFCGNPAVEVKTNIFFD